MYWKMGTTQLVNASLISDTELNLHSMIVPGQPDLGILLLWLDQHP